MESYLTTLLWPHQVQHGLHGAGQRVRLHCRRSPGASAAGSKCCEAAGARLHVLPAYASQQLAPLVTCTKSCLPVFYHYTFSTVLLISVDLDASLLCAPIPPRPPPYVAIAVWFCAVMYWMLYVDTVAKLNETM